MRKAILAYSLFAVTLCFTLRAAAAPEQIVLNSPADSPFSTPNYDGYLDIVIGEALKRAGYTLKIVRLPAERALRNVNEGTEDGDMSRIAGMEKNYPNLIPVPEKLVDMHFAAFSRKPLTQPANWNALREYQVGYIRGWKIFESNIPSGTNVTAVRDHMQLIEMFTRDRLDIILYSKYMGLALAREQRIKEFYLWEPPLATKEMFMYLNKKHAALVPKLARILVQLREEGFTQNTFDKTMGALERQ